MNKLFKKIITGLAIAFTTFSICSCDARAKKELFNQNLTVENYQKFFKVEANSTYKKAIISPLYNKHLSYENVVFNFRNSYSLSSGNERTYDFSVFVDETGNGQEKSVDTGSYISSQKLTILSIEGVVSFKNDYSSFKQIKQVKRDYFHKEDLGVYLNLGGTTSYVLRFKADLNIEQTADTDAFYLIQSVKVKFKATLNNVERSYEYIMYPNLLGIADIPLEEQFSSVKDFSFTYKNGYYLTY